MISNGLSLSDIAAVTDGNRNGGFFGNEGIWAVIILAIIFGWGNNGNGGFFGGGSRSGSSVADAYVLGSDMSMISRQLSDGFNSIDNALDAQNSGICNLGYTQLELANNIGMNLMQGFNTTQNQIADCCCKTQQNIKDTQYAIATTGAGIQSAIKDCCCDNEKATMQTRYDMATQNCATLQAIDKLGDRIIDYMAADKAQALRDENFSLKLASSQACQNNYLLSRLQPTPIPAFNVPSPFGFGYGYGYGGTTIA